MNIRPPRNSKYWMRVGAPAVCLLAVLIPGACAAQEQTPAGAIPYPGLSYDFPMPPRHDDQLFFIQRSENANTLVYDANFREDGSLDPRQPVIVYWLRYQHENGRRMALRKLEKRWIWGVVSKRLNAGQAVYEINLACCRGRKARLVIGDDGRAQVVLRINGEPARLKHVFVTVGEYEFLPNVTQVEIFGEDLTDGRQVYETFVPDLIWNRLKH